MHLRCLKTLRALGIVAALCLLAGQAGAFDLDEIRQRKVIRIAVPAADAPPFLITLPDGSLGGFEGELIADLARRMDVRVELVRSAGGSDELLAQVLADQADLALGRLADSLEWAKSARFTTPYLTLSQVRVADRLRATRAGGVAALLDAVDARVAVWTGSPALPLLREQMDAARIVVLPTMSAALDEARAGRVAGVIGDEIEIDRWLSERAAAALQWKIEVRRDRPITLAMAMHWKSENLQAWVNLYLEKVRHDETLDKLRAKHLGDGRVPGEP